MANSESNINVQNLTNILFLDIETVSGTHEYDEMPEALQKHWDRKAQYMPDYDGYNTKKLFGERAGIFAEFGKIVVIAFGQYYFDSDNKLSLKVKSLGDKDERKLLIEFCNILNKYDRQILLCGHNAKEFDFPYIARRLLINGIQVPDVLNLAGKKPWEVNHIDTMELWKFGDRKNYTSLDLLATILGLPSSKDDMDGSEVGTYYYERDGLDDIATYCRKDVITTAKLYLRLTIPHETPDVQVFEK